MIRNMTENEERTNWKRMGRARVYMNFHKFMRNNVWIFVYLYGSFIYVEISSHKSKYLDFPNNSILLLCSYLAAILVTKIERWQHWKRVSSAYVWTRIPNFGGSALPLSSRSTCLPELFAFIECILTEITISDYPLVATMYGSVPVGGFSVETVTWGEYGKLLH
jgi:hypothetical protein